MYYATEGVDDKVYVCPVVRGCDIEFEFGVVVSTESRTASQKLLYSLNDRYVLTIANLISMQFLDKILNQSTLL